MTSGRVNSIGFVFMKRSRFPLTNNPFNELYVLAIFCLCISLHFSSFHYCSKSSQAAFTKRTFHETGNFLPFLTKTNNVVAGHSPISHQNWLGPNLRKPDRISRTELNPIRKMDRFVSHLKMKRWHVNLRARSQTKARDSGQTLCQ